jgi:hypothetical protein
MTTPLLPPLLLPNQVGDWLLLSTRTVIRLARQRKIPSVTLPDGSLMFEPDALREWVKTLRVQGGHDDAA